LGKTGPAQCGEDAGGGELCQVHGGKAGCRCDGLTLTQMRIIPIK
jgi:hypothetical protein